MNDRPQRIIQIQSGGNDQHGLNQAIHLVADADELRDAVLHLIEQFPKTRLSQRLDYRRSAVAAAVG